MGWAASLRQSLGSLGRAAPRKFTEGFRSGWSDRPPATWASGAYAQSQRSSPSREASRVSWRLVASSQVAVRRFGWIVVPTALAALAALARRSEGPPKLTVLTGALVLAYAGCLAWALRARMRSRTSLQGDGVRAEFQSSALISLGLVGLVERLPSQWAVLVWLGLLLLLGQAALARRPYLAIGVGVWVSCLLVGAGLVRTDSPAPWVALTMAWALGAVLRKHVGLRVAGSEAVAKAAAAAELDRLKQTARSYRLLDRYRDDRTSIPPLEHDAAGDEERSLRGSLEEMHATLEATLALSRAALSARGVLLLSLDPGRKQLSVRVHSSDEGVCERPVGAHAGIFGVAAEAGALVELLGNEVRQPPVYEPSRPCGHLAACWVTSQGAAVGVLLVERSHPEHFTSAQRASFECTASLVQRAIDGERLLFGLQRAKLEQGKLYRSLDQLSAARTEGQVASAAVQSALHFAGVDFAAVTLARGEGQHEVGAAVGSGSGDFVGQRFAGGDGLVAMVVETRHALPVAGQRASSPQRVFAEGLPRPPQESLLVLPLSGRQGVFGTLVLGSHTPAAFGGEDPLSLQLLSRHVAVSLSNAHMIERLESLATCDGPTGLLNKRALTEMAQAKLLSARRFNKPLSVMVCDLDHFKRVNDTYGHDVGDRVIVAFAEVLKRSNRQTDAVGRFGGEEFVMVCEETEEAGALQLSARICSELEAIVFVTPRGSLSVTCSIGIAACNEQTHTWEQVFKLADTALYAAKRTGRNRAVVWSPQLSKTE